MDVNLLPDELKKKEEKELKSKAGEPVTVPMSAPVKESAEKPHHFAVSGSAASTSPGAAAESKLPHVREESYIHEVTKEGKIVHESPPSPALVRVRPSWWRKLLDSFSRSARGSPAGEPSSAELSQPPPPPRPVKPSAIVKESLPPSPLPSPPLPPLPQPPSPPPLPPPLPLSQKVLSPAQDSTPSSEAVPDMRRAAPAPPTPPPVQPSKEEKPVADKLKGGEAGAAASAFGPPSLGINLLPPEWSWNLSLTIQFRRRVLWALALLAAVSVIGSFAGSSIYVSFQERHVAAIRDEQKKVEDETQKYRAQEIEWSNLNSRLKLISALLADHVKVTSVFKFLEETVSPLVQYSSFSFNEGKISVSATTVSYEEMARQIVALRSDQARVSAVDISSYSFDKAKGIVTFSLLITLKPEVWHYGQL